MARRRDVDTFEFSPQAFDRVSGYLGHFTEAGQGWINLLPGVDVDEEQTTAPAGPFALFTGRQRPVTMITLMPPRPARRASEGVTVGLLHPTGAKAVARLAEAGVAFPSGWGVKQDHARRGLLVMARLGAPEAEILEWALAAGACLCREPMTGEWQAVVYLP
ncbi:MAG TPA: hypothetical protein VNG12_07575 [Acidimicrobiales bacterium]|nr:hypothetical protein [Acidimicrobiales bacterium]